MPTSASRTSRRKSAFVRGTLSRGARLAILLYSTAGFVYVLDRLTKVLAESQLKDRPPIRVIPGVLHLMYTTNSGGAFGLFPGQPWVFFIATVVVCLAIIAFASPRLTSMATALGLGLILGGALGNLTDRLIRGSGISGRVVDFIDFQIWPVFNIADSAIVIGAAIVILSGLRRTP
jgi:signal peptidase II